MTVESKIFKDEPADWAKVEEIEKLSNQLLELAITAFETMPEDQYRKVMNAVRAEGGAVGQIAGALGGTGYVAVHRMQGIGEVEYKCGECDETHKGTGLELVYECLAAVEAVATARRFRAYCKAHAADKARTIYTDSKGESRVGEQVNVSGPPSHAAEDKSAGWKARFADRLKREVPNLGPHTTAAHVVLGGPDGAEPPAEFLDQVVENIKSALK